MFYRRDWVLETIIEIRNAGKSFKEQCIFQNVNLDIRKGQVYGILGHNGCGKSVLLKTICGFSRLTEGSITYDGKQIGKDIDFLPNAGIVIEHPEFIPDISGFKNLQILAEIQHKIDNARIDEVLKMFDLYEERNKKVGQYSIGMKQKLRLAQAIMEFPEILILDEPTAGLDQESIERLYDILHTYKKDGGTLIMTSHNKNDIDRLCDLVYEYQNYNFLENCNNKLNTPVE